MGIPPYNGGLFENDDKAYLKDYKIANRFLAEALVELAYLSDPKGETKPELIDYRDLSVRHLGSLYEGMIEYRLFIAEEELLARRDKDGKVKYLSAEKTGRNRIDDAPEKGKIYFAKVRTAQATARITPPKIWWNAWSADVRRLLKRALLIEQISPMADRNRCHAR